MRLPPPPPPPHSHGGMHGARARHREPGFRALLAFFLLWSRASLAFLSLASRCLAFVPLSTPFFAPWTTLANEAVALSRNFSFATLGFNFTYAYGSKFTPLRVASPLAPF